MQANGNDNEETPKGGRPVTKRVDYNQKAEEEQGDGMTSSDLKATAMILWTRRSAFFLGFCAFIVMFLLSFDFENYLDTKMLIITMIKSSCAFLLFWVGGLIIGNILLKGLVTDIPVSQSHLVDGGVLQRVYLYQQLLNYDMDGNVIQIDPTTDKVVKQTRAKDVGGGGGSSAS